MRTVTAPAAGFVLAVAACLALGACGGDASDTTTEPESSEPAERVDPEKLAEDMRKRASEEINAENLDAEIEKLEDELANEGE
jgi:hypothetical protein